MFKSRLILDRGRYFYSLYITNGNEPRKGIPLACHTLCDNKLRRPHLTCLWCRVRRVWYGKMPSKIPVKVVVLQVNEQQKHPWVKWFIRKYLLTLIGWTLN